MSTVLNGIYNIIGYVVLPTILQPGGIGIDTVWIILTISIFLCIGITANLFLCPF